MSIPPSLKVTDNFGEVEVLKQKFKNGIVKLDNNYWDCQRGGVRCPNRNTYRRGRDIFWNNSITVLLFCDVDNLWVTIELIFFQHSKHGRNISLLIMERLL